MKRCWQWMVAVLLAIIPGLLPVLAQVPGVPPAGAACVVSAGNRNAPLAADGSYTVFGIPGNLGAIRARATCSDGSVGQSQAAFTNPFAPDTIELGPISFGHIDPVPIAAALTASSNLLRTGDNSQLTMTAIGLDGSVHDVTPRIEGTVYSVSNALLAAVSEDGLVHIFPEFAPGSSARLIASATTEGSVSATFLYTLGPRGMLTGQVLRADGTTPVVGAEVSVLRLQPVEQAGTAVADADGRFELADVSAGPFMLSALDRGSGDRALGFARIDSEGQSVNIDLLMNGQSTVLVHVIDADGQSVTGAEVTLTALGAFRDTRLLVTDAAGQASFAAITAGDFTVSARQPATRLVGASVDRVGAGESKTITLKLQPIGSIVGRVFDVDGSSLKPGVQVRILSRERGILTQNVVGDDAGFQFDTLPLSDGPYTLDAFVDGRLRARVPGIVLPAANVAVVQDIQLGAVGVVQGSVRNLAGEHFANAVVTMQSLVGLRISFEARSDAGGRFVLPAVPVGAFELSATTADGQTGRSQGVVVQDGDTVSTDVLIAGNTIVGTVFARDGVTPVGAGVRVYLAAGDRNPPYSYAGVAGVTSTSTDADGRFGFEVTQANVYILQAEDGLDRGRTEVVLVNLDPSQPLQARVVFLAKGTVSGSVRDPNGATQAGVPVSLRTEGAFTATLTTFTDAAGNYVLPGVFAGDITASAVNPLSALAGIAIGRLDFESQGLNLDIVLHPTAAVAGAVTERDGVPVTSPVRVSLRQNGAMFAVAEFPDGGAFRFEHVPLGDIELVAEKLENGDRGIASTRLAIVNQTRNVPIRLIGKSEIRVTLFTETGAPVVGATVSYREQGGFNENRTEISGADGRALFSAVFAGDFNLTANKIEGVSSLSGAAEGTLIASQPMDISITLSARPIGAVSGVVRAANGIDPVGAGWVVRMLPEPFLNAFVTTTDGDGHFRFASVPAGTYTIDGLRWFAPNSCPDRDRVRGRAGGVVLASAGEEVVRDVQLIGQGQLFGRTIAADGSGVAGVTITLTNPDPVTGFNVTCSGATTYVTTSDASGGYRFADLPPGNFTVTALAAGGNLQAEGQGRIGFDGDEVELDLTMVDSAITLPRSFHDANGFKFDIGGSGAVLTGTNNVFAGTAPDANAERLSIVTAGVPVPFVNGNGTIGSLQVGGQQIEVDDGVAAGLTVTRRVYVPRNGYFARYLEILHNPGTDPVTVSVRLISHHSPAASNPRVVDSSDGDQIFTVNGSDGQDRWLVLDDQEDRDPFGASSIPATGHMFDGPGGAIRAAQASYSLIGQTGKLLTQWNDITVPAGESVILMHFTWNQIDRFAAREAALRLAQLPPEAIDDLTTDERAQIRNFLVPETSSLPPLPNLDAGEITGRVLSGDGVSAVAGAVVRFKSKHPLFGRQRFADSAVAGGFGFRSRLDGSVDNAVIPVFAFDLEASYARSGARSATTPGDFAPDTSAVVQDLVFIGTGDIKGSVRRHNGATVADAFVILCKFDNRFACTNTAPNPVNSANSAADGRFALFANPPREYFLFASKAHPQQGRPIFGRGSGAATAGDVTVADVNMEETGSIAGFIRSADGQPVVDADIQLSIVDAVHGGGARYARSDTAGHYRFFDVPLGVHSIRATDPISHSEGTVAGVTVRVDEETPQDITLAGSGTLNVRVRFARGSAAGSGVVEYAPSAGKLADANGLATFQLPDGEYTIRAYLPEAPNTSAVYSGTAAASISGNGQTSEVVVVLPPAGTVSGTIVRPDGSTLAGGFPYTLRSISGTGIPRRQQFTAATGVYREPALPVGRYLITAFDAGQDRFADAEFEITEDGQELVLDLTLLPDRIALPADLRDANRFRFDVQQAGSLAEGSGAYAGAAAQLTVNGQSYVGETSARLDAERRQFVIAQAAAIDGLRITRKIFVPRGAYFARYLEVFDNPTASPISAGVELSSRYLGGAVLSTANGDTLAGAEDHWVVLDDTVDQDIALDAEQMPALAEVFSNPGASAAPDLVAIDHSSGQPVLVRRWNQLSVPAGGRVVLMHFAVQQINRRGAAAAVERLSQVPPEVLAFTDADERAAIVNFAVPTDGVSTVAPLPGLTGTVAGVALEGDQRTPVRGAHISVQSSHPLFNRNWGLRPDPYPWCTMPGTVIAGLISTSTVPGGVQNPPPLGSFALAGQLTADDSIVVPEGVPLQLTAQVNQFCFYRYSGHSTTKLPSRVIEVIPSVTANVVWDSGVLTGTLNGTLDFSVTGGRVYRSTDDPDPEPLQFVPIAADGTYVYPGLPPGTVDVLFDTTGPQSELTGDLRGQRLAAQVNLGQITVTDVDLQPTGKLQGAVLTANGEAAVNAQVTLSSLASQQTYDQCAAGCVPDTLDKNKGRRAVRRVSFTDSLGRYNFAAVPSGEYTLRVVDPDSDSVRTANLVITADQVFVQNIILPQPGTIALTVRDAAGLPVNDALVILHTDALGADKLVGRTDAQGRLTVANIAEGPYTLRVKDPRFPNIAYFERSVAGVVPSTGLNINSDLQLLAAATLSVSVVDNQAGGVPLAAVQIKISDGRGSRFVGQTDALGRIAISGVPAGGYTVTASLFRPTGLVEKIAVGEIGLADDNQTRTVSFDLGVDVVPLPQQVYGANRDFYTLGTDWSTSTSNPAPLSVGGIRFTGANSGTLQLGGREVVVAGPALIAGLRVSRRQFVPVDGYFARYLEVLENPGVTEIVTSVVVEQSGQNCCSILATSSGDALLSNTGPDRDYWFAAGSGSRTSVYLAGGPNGAAAAQIASFNFGARLTWEGLRIPAGGRVMLLHFRVEAPSLLAARAAATRLAQLPPEALAGLSVAEQVSVATFPMPPDGTSTLPALPALNARLSGRVLNGDGSPVVGARVSVRTAFEPFDRLWDSSLVPTLITDADGAYLIQGTPTNTPASLPLPVGSDLQITVQHPQSLVNLAVTAGFVPGTANASADLQFGGGAIHGRLTGAFHSPQLRGEVRASRAGFNSQTLPIAEDGSFVIGGLAAATYQLRGELRNAFGQSLLVGTQTGVVVLSGQGTTRDIPLPANGAVSGRVLSAGGIPVVGRQVDLGNWRAITDASGQFAFDAVPVGTYVLHTSNTLSGAEVAASVDVSADQLLVHDLVDVGTGTVRLTVRTATGALAPNIAVFMTATSQPGERQVGRTSLGTGELLIVVPVGEFTLRAQNDNNLESTAITGNLLADGDSQNLNLTMKPWARARVRVQDADADHAAINNALLLRLDSRQAQERSDGLSGQAGVPGEFAEIALRAESWLSALTVDGRESTIRVALVAADDGQLLTPTISIRGSLARLGSIGFANERQVSSVHAEAGDRIAFGVVPITSYCAYELQVFPPAGGSPLASARRYGEAANFNGQTNSLGNARDVIAEVAGDYLVSVGATCADSLGDYRLSASIDNQPVAVVGPPMLGAVQGRALRADGITPFADALIELTELGIGTAVQRITSGPDGSFGFAAVGLGAFRLAFVPTPDRAAIPLAEASIDSVGQSLALDVVLPAVTRFQIQVVDGLGMPVPYAAVDFFSGTATTPFAQLSTGGTGLLDYIHYGSDPIRVVGNTPIQPEVTAERVLAPSDGQTVAVSLQPVAASIGGFVRDPDGQAVAGVLIQALRDSSAIADTYSDSLGAFLLPSLPLGAIELVARDPRNQVTTRSTINLDQASLHSQDVTLTGQGKLLVHVVRPSGAPVRSAQIALSYDDQGETISTLMAYTDDDGRATVASVPIDRPIRVEASKWAFGDTDTAVVMSSLAAHGESVPVEIELATSAPQVDVRILPADGLPMPGTCTVRLVVGSESGDQQTADCGAIFHLESSDQGSGVLSAEGDYFESDAFTVELLPATRITLDIPVSVIAGQVLHADGEAVAGAELLGEAADGSQRSGQGDAAGNYRLFGLRSGPFTLTATDAVSGLSASQASVMADVAVPVWLDFTLPGFGSVAGTLTDPSGVALPYTAVYLDSTGFANAIERQTETDDQGGYRFERVALGKISVGALAGQSFGVATAAANGGSGSANVANGFTELSQQGESQTLDLQFGATGTISGTAWLAAGDPAANHCLELRSSAEGVAFRRLSVDAYIDSDGHFEFSDVAPGPVSILLRNCEYSPSPGYAAGVVQAGTNLALDVTLGNAASLPVSLTDSVSGASAEVLAEGGPGLYDPYLFAVPPLLRIDDYPYPGQLLAIRRQNGRELELPALSLAGLRVTRRYYVPASGGYVRVLESFHNASAAGIAVPFRLAGRHADPAPGLTTSIPAGRWWLQSSASSGDAIAYVLNGTPAGIPNALDFAEGQRRFGWGFDLDIEARGTQRYLYYLVPRTADAAAAAAQAEALSQQTEPGMFDGLSAEERAEIQNFEVPAP